MLRRPPRYTRTYTLFPDTTLFRSNLAGISLVTCADFGAAFSVAPVIDAVVSATADSVANRTERSIANPLAINLAGRDLGPRRDALQPVGRSEEHTSELQSLMRSSYAVFCLKKKNKTY